MVLFILTTIIIIGIFTITFAKMIKKNSASMVYILAIEFVGILVAFFNLIKGKTPLIFEYIIIFFCSVIIPIFIFILARKNSDFIESIELFLMRIKKGNKKEKLLNIIDKNPDNYWAHRRLADYYVDNSEKEKAEDEYIKAIQIKQDDYKSYCKLAKLLHENKKDEQAIEILQLLMKLKPDYYEGSMTLGQILYENEKHKEAISVYNQALKYNPTQYDIYYCLGMTYTRLNDFKNAIDFYKKAATINSYKDISELNLGQINLIFKDYEKAEEYFYNNIKSEDEKITAIAYYYLAKIRIIQGNEEQAIQYAELSLEIYPRIIKKMRSDDLFIPILGKINFKVRGEENRELKSNISTKDEEVVEYLGNTFNVVETLTNDFNGLKTSNNRTEEKQIEY